MSFGHFILDLRPILLIVFETARADVKVNNVVFLIDTFGFKIIERYNPPFGENHTLLNLPLPFSCSLARIIVPSSSPFLASSFGSKA